MKELLDAKNLKKVAMIEAVAYSEKQTCAQDILIEGLGITYPTLITMMESINEDMISFGFSSSSIHRNSSTLTYSLNNQEGVSVQMIIHRYIRESTKFRILELLLTNNFANLSELAQLIHVSYRAVRKDVKELNHLLDKRKMSISIKSGVRLQGDELGIRLYYTFLFLSTYGGESWPFSYIHYFEITKLMSYCPKEIYRSGTIDKSMLVHYYVAIHYLRERRGHVIPAERSFSVPLYHPYSLAEKESSKRFVQKARKYLPNVNEEGIEKSANMLFSVLLAFGGYASINHVPSFFYQEKAFEKIRFLEMIQFIFEQVSHELSIPLSNEEKEKLIYSLVSVNYRYFLFEGLNTRLDPFIMKYSKLEVNPRKAHKVRHLTRLVKELLELKPLEGLLSFKENIATDYLIIFDKRIDFSLHTQPIKIAVLAAISNEIASSDIMNYFSNYYHLVLAEDFDSTIDLFISDYPLSADVLHALRIHLPIVYVNSRLEVSDYEKINTQLAEIAESKFINKNNK